MNERFKTENPELNDLFDRYRRSPDGHIFAPLADACRKAGMLDEAIEICSRGLSANPRYASGYVVQGKTFFDMGDNESAEASFTQVLSLDEDNLVALKYLGVIAATRGQGMQARRYFEHILVLDPENREIRERLAHLPEESTAEAPADAQHEDAFEGQEITLGSGTQTSDVLATLTLANIYAAQGYRRKAIRIYRDLLEKQPGNREVEARIEALESGEEVPAAPVTPEVIGPAAGSTVEVEKEPPADAVDEKAAPPEPARPGDDSRNYDQFKRWIQSMNR